MKAIIKINTNKGIKSISKDFANQLDAQGWLCGFKSDRYFGYTDDGCFAVVNNFDFSQLETAESAEP